MTPSRPLRSVTVEGKTVQEAIEKGLAILGVPRSQVVIRALAEGNTGLFGMRGAKPAKVRISLKSQLPSLKGESVPKGRSKQQV